MKTNFSEDQELKLMPDKVLSSIYGLTKCKLITMSHIEAFLLDLSFDDELQTKQNKTTTKKVMLTGGF